MNGEKREVSTVSELQAAAANTEVRQIVVSASISEMPTLRMSPGQMLTGSDARPALHFAEGSHGLQLSADNQVEGLQLIADPDKRALFNDTGVEQLGRTRITRSDRRRRRAIAGARPGARWPC